MPHAFVTLNVTTAAWACQRTMPVRRTRLCCTSSAPSVARRHRRAWTRPSFHFCFAVFQTPLAHVSLLGCVSSSAANRALGLDHSIASRHIERVDHTHDVTGSLNVRPCKRIQLRINIGSSPHARAVQLLQLQCAACNEHPLTEPHSDAPNRVQIRIQVRCYGDPVFLMSLHPMTTRES